MGGRRQRRRGGGGVYEKGTSLERGGGSVMKKEHILFMDMFINTGFVYFCFLFLRLR